MFLQSRAEISSCTVPALCLLKLLPFFALPSPPLLSLSFLSFFTRTTLSLREEGKGGGGGGLDLALHSQETRCINYQYRRVLASNIRSLHFRLPCLSRAPRKHPIRCCLRRLLYYSPRFEYRSIGRYLDFYFTSSVQIYRRPSYFWRKESLTSPEILLM